MRWNKESCLNEEGGSKTIGKWRKRKEFVFFFFGCFFSNFCKYLFIYVFNLEGEEMGRGSTGVRQPAQTHADFTVRSPTLHIQSATNPTITCLQVIRAKVGPSHLVKKSGTLSHKCTIHEKHFWYN